MKTKIIEPMPCVPIDASTLKCTIIRRLIIRDISDGKDILRSVYTYSLTSWALARGYVTGWPPWVVVNENDWLTKLF